MTNRQGDHIMVIVDYFYQAPFLRGARPTSWRTKASTDRHSLERAADRPA
jgi:hypothetical protein